LFTCFLFYICFYFFPDDSYSFFLKSGASLPCLCTMPWRRVKKWRYSSTILDLGTRWRWVVSFTSRSLYHRGNSPWYPLDRRLWIREKSIAAAGNWTPAIQLVACHYTDWAIQYHNFKLACPEAYVYQCFIRDSQLMYAPVALLCTDCTCTLVAKTM
jgi:hypothetical protein